MQMQRPHFVPINPESKHVCFNAQTVTTTRDTAHTKKRAGELLSALTKKLNIQANRAHEEIDILEALGSHVGRQGLGERDRGHDTVFDGDDQPRLLIRIRANAQRGQELPHVDVVARVDGAGKHVRERGLDEVEKLVVRDLPAPC